MKIKIIPLEILNNTDSEENLSDLSLLESFYAMRKLKLAIFYGSEIIIEIDKEKEYKENHQQVFIKKFDIWINKNEYVIV